MARNENVWLCDICSKTYKSEELAEDCEKNHLSQDDLEIIGVAGHYGHLCGFPLSLKIHVKNIHNNNKYDEAMYQLICLGTPDGDWG